MKRQYPGFVAAKKGKQIPHFVRDDIKFVGSWLAFFWVWRGEWIEESPSAKGAERGGGLRFADCFRHDEVFFGETQDAGPEARRYNGGKTQGPPSRKALRMGHPGDQALVRLAGLKSRVYVGRD